MRPSFDVRELTLDDLPAAWPSAATPSAPTRNRHRTPPSKHPA
ncbi:hypothetical protein ABZ671_22275 [Micromonospora sp. NPDC006766]